MKGATPRRTSRSGAVSSSTSGKTTTGQAATIHPASNSGARDRSTVSSSAPKRIHPDSVGNSRLSTLLTGDNSERHKDEAGKQASNREVHPRQCAQGAKQDGGQNKSEGDYPHDFAQPNDSSYGGPGPLGPVVEHYG